MALPLFDVALSFAGEQREYVRAVAARLHPSGVTYFFDEERRVDLWGRNLVDELDSTYRIKARYVVMFVSEAYATKVWTNLERQSAQSRAIESADPYILPVRFDDTDLPGLPGSVSYIDARTTTAEELGDLIVAKISQAHAAEPEEDREPGWEYLLLIDELQAGLAGYDAQWIDHTMRVASPGGSRIDLVDVPNDISTRARVAGKIVSNITGLFGDNGIVAALGAPGEPGDPGLIRHVAAGVVDIYASLLRWTADSRGALAPTEVEEAYMALSELVDAPLRQIRDWVGELDSSIRPVVDAIRSGNPPAEQVRLVLTLTLSIPDDVTERLEKAISGLGGLT